MCANSVGIKANKKSTFYVSLTSKKWFGSMYRHKNSTIQILLEFMTKTENHRHRKIYVNIK